VKPLITIISAAYFNIILPELFRILRAFCLLIMQLGKILYPVANGPEEDKFGI
jgi:hypothetical protein